LIPSNIGSQGILYLRYISPYGGIGCESTIRSLQIMSAGSNAR
jgi:hypothetical protein